MKKIKIKACWVAREQKNGWKLLYCQDRNNDVELDFLFMNEKHIKFALGRGVVFVHMDKTSEGLSVVAKNALLRNNLTLSKCRKMTDEQLLSLPVIGKITLQEIRNKS